MKLLSSTFLYKAQLQKVIAPNTAIKNKTNAFPQKIMALLAFFFPLNSTISNKSWVSSQVFCKILQWWNSSKVWEKKRIKWKTHNFVPLRISSLYILGTSEQGWSEVREGNLGSFLEDPSSAGDDERTPLSEILPSLACAEFGPLEVMLCCLSSCSFLGKEKEIRN